MRKVTKNREYLVEDCPYCNKAIIGTTKNQVEYNMLIHIHAKHPDKNIPIEMKGGKKENGK